MVVNMYLLKKCQAHFGDWTVFVTFALVYHNYDKEKHINQLFIGKI